MVLRLKQKSEGNHKLSPQWEGPFLISRVLNNGAYRLYDIEKEKEECRAWNAELLCRFYA